MIPIVPPVQKHPAALPGAGHRRDAKFHRATIARFRLCDAGKLGAVGVWRLNLLKIAPSRNALLPYDLPSRGWRLRGAASPVAVAIAACLGFTPSAVQAAMDAETQFVLNTFSFLIWGALVM